MRTSTGQCDFVRTAEVAERMTVHELLGALRDIERTLDFADANDRLYGGNEGGYYRDEASVYHAEIRKRRGEK